MRKLSLSVPLSMLLSIAPVFAQAADLDGSQLGGLWAVPFVGLLLAIAIMPLAAPQIWHHHFGKISLAWSLAYLIPCAIFYGPALAAGGALHAFLEEYIPFIILLTTLFTVAGGIYFRGNLHGSPWLNTGILAFGAFLASLMGTTGAAMLLIRPIINANDNRKHTVHLIVFFIFIVANAGGALTPLGDPPLFLGFLKGVDFSWTVLHMLPETLFVVLSLLAIFFCIDWYFFHHREEERPAQLDPTPDSPFSLEGKINFVLLFCVVGLVLMSGLWKPGISLQIGGVEVALQNIVRDVALLAVVGLSLRLTPASARAGNDFNWGPMLEVGKLFAGIFITIIPVIAMLRAGTEGAFGFVVRSVTDAQGQPINAMYFWATGLLSSFLDNAPTYLVFFNTAGGDAQVLMNVIPATLVAISCGAVFMGANSYIGNAPNMMVKAIAEQRGIRMPSFFGYMAWSTCILGPLFIAMTFIFF